jgi:hypothetical protein
MKFARTLHLMLVVVAVLAATAAVSFAGRSQKHSAGPLRLATAARVSPWLKQHMRIFREPARPISARSLAILRHHGAGALGLNPRLARTIHLRVPLQRAATKKRHAHAADLTYTAVDAVLVPGANGRLCLVSELTAELCGDASQIAEGNFLGFGVCGTVATSVDRGPSGDSTHSGVVAVYMVLPDEVPITNVRFRTQGNPSVLATGAGNVVVSLFEASSTTGSTQSGIGLPYEILGWRADGSYVFDHPLDIDAESATCGNFDAPAGDDIPAP